MHTSKTKLKVHANSLSSNYVKSVTAFVGYVIVIINHIHITHT